jgi:hypothetical protein
MGSLDSEYDLLGERAGLYVMISGFPIHHSTCQKLTFPALY